MRRTRLEIFLQMLEKCIEPMRFTHVMGEMHLSFQLTKECVTKLQKAGLLSVERGSKSVMLRTTDKGIEILKKFKPYFDVLMEELG